VFSVSQALVFSVSQALVFSVSQALVFSVSQAIVYAQCFLSIGLCACFWRKSYQVDNYYHFLRAICYLGILNSITSMGDGCFSYASIASTLECLVIFSASYGSLYLLSALILLRLCCILSIVFVTVITVSSFVEKSYYLRLNKSFRQTNAYSFSLELAHGLSVGFNLTYLTALLCSKIPLICPETAPSGISFICLGRTKGQTLKTRTCSLCVGSFSSGILDYGFTSVVSGLGVCGIKVSLC